MCLKLNPKPWAINWCMARYAWEERPGEQNFPGEPMSFLDMPHAVLPLLPIYMCVGACVCMRERVREKEADTHTQIMV